MNMDTIMIETFTDDELEKKEDTGELDHESIHTEWDIGDKNG